MGCAQFQWVEKRVLLSTYLDNCAHLLTGKTEWQKDPFGTFFFVADDL